MNVISLSSLLVAVICLRDGFVSGQVYPSTCCSGQYYQTATCCPQPCCYQSAAPALCCQTPFKLPEVMKFRLTVKTTLTYDNAFADPKSDKYKALVKKFQEAVKKAYAKTPSFADVRVDQFTKGSVIPRFVLAFTAYNLDPLKPLRDALATKYIPNDKDSGKIQVDINSLKLVDKVYPASMDVYLDTKPSCKQETDDQIKASILKELNAKRVIHQAKGLTVDKKLEAAALEHTKQLVSYPQLAYSAKEKDQSELAVRTCKKPNECLTGKDIIAKWYSESSVFNDAKIPLSKKAVDAKRFMQLVWKSSTAVGIGVQNYKYGIDKCFVAVAFITPKAKTLTTDKDVKSNVLAAKKNREEPLEEDAQQSSSGMGENEDDAYDNDDDDESVWDYDENDPMPWEQNEQ